MDSLTSQTNFGQIKLLLEEIFRTDSDRYKWLMSQNSKLNFMTPALALAEGKSIQVMNILTDLREICRR